MAVATFGVTGTMLDDRFFGSGLGTRATEIADDVIAEVAAELEVHIRAAKVEPDEITEGHSPRAYRWIQNALAKGAAAELATRIGSADPDVVENWREDFRRYVGELRSNSNVILGDITTRGRKSRACFGWV